MELYDWQKDAIKSFEKNRYNGIIVAVTGTGKTFVATEILKNLKQRTLIVVPTIPLMNQWKTELLKAGIKEEDLGLYYGSVKKMNKVTVAVINSVYKLTKLERKFSFLILDETHRMASDEWKGLLLNNPFKYKLGLTATLERSDGNHIFLEERLGGVVYEYTTKDAVRDDLLNEFIIYNIGIDLPKREKEYLMRLDEDIRVNMERFNNDLNKVINSIKRGNKYAAKVLRLINQRKQFYNNSVPKIDFAKALIRAYIGSYISPYNSNIIYNIYNNTNNKGKNKIIVFGEYIETADILYKNLKSEGIDSYVYYSGNKKSIFKLNNKDKKSLIENFKEDDNAVLITVKALDEGLNVKDANIGIILGYNKTQRQAIQRMGRILRKQEGKKPVLFNFYYRNTNDYFNAKNFADNFEGVGKIIWV